MPKGLWDLPENSSDPGVTRRGSKEAEVAIFVDEKDTGKEEEPKLKPEKQTAKPKRKKSKLDKDEVEIR